MRIARKLFLAASFIAAAQDAFASGRGGTGAQRTVEHQIPTVLQASPQARPVPRADDLVGLMREFSHGLIPDLDNPSQRRLFEFYIRNYFGGDVRDATPERIEHLSELLDVPRSFAKDRLGSVETQFVVRKRAPSPAMVAMAADLVRTFGALKALFLRPLANSGQWTKLKLDGQPIFSQASIAMMLETIAEKVSREGVEHRRVFALYREFFARAQVRDPARVQLLISLAHALAFYSDDIQAGLKSKDAHTVARAIEAGIDARALYFNDLLKAEGDVEATLARGNFVTKVALPTTEALRARSAEAAAVAAEEITISKSMRVRPLSSIESPFRSCLAADCATRTWFDRALDPAYYFFTLTDGEGRSSGHVTIVLGQADHNGRPKMTALIDKIQGIPLSEVELVLDAVRVSVAQAGYELAVPLDTGDINGLSNDATIREEIGTISTLAPQQIQYEKFRPDPGTSRYGAVGLSRAQANLKVRPLLPRRNDPQAPVQYVIHAPAAERQADGLADLWTAISSAFRLRNGSSQERIQYLSLMESLARTGMPVEPGFAEFAAEMARSQQEPLAVRNRAMKALLSVAPEKIPPLWAAFRPGEIATLLQNWNQAKVLDVRLRWLAWTAIPYASRELAFLRANLRRSLSDRAFEFLVGATQTPMMQRGAALISEAERKARLHESRLYEAFAAFAGAADAKRAGEQDICAELERHGIDVFIGSGDSLDLPAIDLSMASRFIEILRSSGLGLSTSEFSARLEREVENVRPTLRLLRLRKFLEKPMFVASMGPVVVGGMLGIAATIVGARPEIVDIGSAGIIAAMATFIAAIGNSLTMPGGHRIEARETRLTKLREALNAISQALAEYEKSTPSSSPALMRSSRELICHGAVEAKL